MIQTRDLSRFPEVKALVKKEPRRWVPPRRWDPTSGGCGVCAPPPLSHPLLLPVLVRGMPPFWWVRTGAGTQCGLPGLLQCPGKHLLLHVLQVLLWGVRGGAGGGG